MAMQLNKADIEEFAASVKQLSVPEDVAYRVYEYLHATSLLKPKRIKADDGLYIKFGLAEEDLNDAALELITMCHRIPPLPGQLVDQPPLRTVGDLVQFIARLASRQ